MIKRVTDRSAVEAAMDEFDRVGRDAFLEKYQFGPALRYFVIRNGKSYDSKAIYGAAHRMQFPDEGEISSSDFSGGEQAVQIPLEALGFEFVEFERSAGAEDMPNLKEASQLTTEDVRLIASSRSKKRYAELSQDEKAAYVRVTQALQALGNTLNSSLSKPRDFEVQLTSGFNLKSGVRSYIPKDLWFSVSLRANSKDFAGMPQLFMIVSERGIEYGYGASVSPSDFSQQTVKDIVRKAAPIVFEQLPSPDTPEATGIQHDLEASGGWYFRRKHRLPPNQQEFPSFKNWLRYLQSPEGKRNAAGTISRYVLPDDVDQTDWASEVEDMARVFEPLMVRDWSNSPVSSLAAKDETMSTRAEGNMAGGREFATKLETFLAAFAEARRTTYQRGDNIAAAMDDLRSWLESAPAIAKRPLLKIKISVGVGEWARIPWIALMDERVTNSTQRGFYVVFLISEDLSVTYLTLNQGSQALVAQLGKNEAIAKMNSVARDYRSKLPDLEKLAFKASSNIDLRSSSANARNYQEGTIAFAELENDELPDDKTINTQLEHILACYDLLVETSTSSEAVVPEETIEAPIQPDIEPYSVEDALKELFLEREDVERYIDIWRNKKNLILQGAPGVGKSFIARHLAYLLIGFKDDSKVQTVQFHQSYSYEDFVQGYRPNGSQGFERKNGTFYEFRDRALRDPGGTYVFIIDEINRGNLSKIFGELMLLIEPDKRGETWKTRLAYATDDDRDFYVPENLFILGMMNTADRSLSLVD